MWGLLGSEEAELVSEAVLEPAALAVETGLGSTGAALERTPEAPAGSMMAAGEKMHMRECSAEIGREQARPECIGVERSRRVQVRDTNLSGLGEAGTGLTAVSKPEREAQRIAGMMQIES